MELADLIIPKERRVVVYTVLNGEIINSNQKNNLVGIIFAHETEIIAARNKCIEVTVENENLFSFVYVHSGGTIEIETNVKIPRHQQHTEYNS